MATNFEQAPEFLNGVRSPMIYTLKDPFTGKKGFQYVLDVFIWAGDPNTLPTTPKYTLKKPPLVNGLASFDISNLVKSEIQILPQPYNIKDVTEGGISILNVACKAGYIDATGSDLANTTSETVWATNGYYDYLEGFNQSLQDYDLTDRTKYLLRDDGNEIGCTFYDPNINVTKINYRSKNNLYTLNLSTYYNILGNLNSPEKILYFPIGIANLTAYNNTVGPFPSLTAVLNEGLISIGYDTTVFEYIKEVEILCEPKYQPITVYFVNKYGAWDWLNFMKRKDFKTTMNSGEYTTRASQYLGNALTYNTDEGQIKRFNVDGSQFITMNTGYINEEAGDLVEQLLISENIIASIDGHAVNNRPLNIESKEVDYKLGVNEKLINYTITFKVAATLLNTM